MLSVEQRFMFEGSLRRMAWEEKQEAVREALEEERRRHEPLSCRVVGGGYDYPMSSSEILQFQNTQEMMMKGIQREDAKLFRAIRRRETEELLRQDSFDRGVAAGLYHLGYLK